MAKDLNKVVTVDLSLAEITLILGAIGNDSRNELHAHIAEDFGRDVAETVMPLPEQVGIFVAMMEDKAGPLYSKLNEHL